MLALDALSAEVTAIFYILAVVAFVLAGMNWSRWGDSNLVAIGLALYVFPQAWNALAAA
jgi:ABC-type dipeptide/oligopeptide/nickel transport system permease component